MHGDDIISRQRNFKIAQLSKGIQLWVDSRTMVVSEPLPQGGPKLNVELPTAHSMSR